MYGLFLAIILFLSLFAGVSICLEAQSAMHQIVALLCFLISVVALAGLGCYEELKKLSKRYEPVKTTVTSIVPINVDSPVLSKIPLGRVAIVIAFLILLIIAKYLVG